MENKNQQEEANKILSKNSHGENMPPEDLGDAFFEGDGIITEALENATEQLENVKENKSEAMKKKAAKKRKIMTKAKKQAGIRPGKQSKFPTRSHSFLSKPISDRAIHVVLHSKDTEIYKDGADICPRIVMGFPAYGKTCKRNAFEHLIALQNKIREFRGEDPKKAPRWIIISNDTSIINDRNIISRLEELKDTTHAAGSYGFEKIRASGKWYHIDPETEQVHLRGCYIQANEKNINWDFIVGSKFKESPKYRILIVHGPFIAIRGETFMQIDFTEMANNVKRGFFHYMADISMECLKRRQMVAQIKTISTQFENINEITSNEEFQHDQSYFASKWQSLLPASIYDNK